MPAWMSRMLAICEPMWKCSSCMQSSMSASRRRSSSPRDWLAESPNLAFSPPVFCHLPLPMEARRTRMPSMGRTPRSRASSMTSASSEGFSMTM
jgi:hypothetical protein